jgi:hypothetical protein
MIAVQSFILVCFLCCWVHAFHCRYEWINGLLLWPLLLIRVKMIQVSLMLHWIWLFMANAIGLFKSLLALIWLEMGVSSNSFVYLRWGLILWILKSLELARIALSSVLVYNVTIFCQCFLPYLSSIWRCLSHPFLTLSHFGHFSSLDHCVGSDIV